MSCDEYWTCPKCGKCEGLKIWFGRYIGDPKTNLEINIEKEMVLRPNEIHGGCTNCDFTIKKGDIKIKVI